MEREAVLDAENANRLRNDLYRISHAIHLTDWSKNESEVQYAVLVEQAAATVEAGPARILEERTRLTELVGRHEAAVGIGADECNEDINNALPAIEP